MALTLGSFVIVAHTNSMSSSMKSSLHVIVSGWSSDEDSPSPGKQDKCASLYQPHLRFQITSEDGFSVEADSMDGQFREILYWDHEKSNWVSSYKTWAHYNTFPSLCFFSGVESSNGWCPGGTDRPSAGAVAHQQGQWCQGAGCPPRCCALPAGAVAGCFPLPETPFPFPPA